MFSDIAEQCCCDIAEQFSMRKTKRAYYFTLEIAPYFKNKFVKSLQLLPFYSVSFDESWCHKASTNGPAY